VCVGVVVSFEVHAKQSHMHLDEHSYMIAVACAVERCRREEHGLRCLRVLLSARRHTHTHSNSANLVDEI
jgi:hypothetical protein